MEQTMTKAPTRCKAAELADRAVELNTLIGSADAEFLTAKDDAAKSAALAQLETCHRDLQKIEGDACRRYAASDKGALFQAIAARDALSILRSSNMEGAQREEFFTRVDRALESIERFFANKSTQLAAVEGMCRARPSR
jgi:hypothetical protein